MSAPLGRRPLEALNFFMADFQAGIGPFLGVYLAAQGWKNGNIGTVMTLGGVAGMAMSAPAGAWVDATTKKRALVAVTAFFTIAASLIVLITQEFWVVSVSQIATAMAGAAIVPAVGGITLGMVGQKGFGKQNGRNQSFNHAGNVVGAALSGLLGWHFGLTAVFWLSIAFGGAAIVSVVLVPESSIDHRVTRGLAVGVQTEGTSGFRALYDCRALLVLAAALMFFHLGNASMLPLLGLELSEHTNENPALLVATTVVVAQAGLATRPRFRFWAPSLAYLSGFGSALEKDWSRRRRCAAALLGNKSWKDEPEAGLRRALRCKIPAAPQKKPTRASVPACTTGQTGTATVRV